MHKPRLISILFVALMLLAAPWTGAQAVQNVPKDALLFVRVRNIQQVSQKIANYAQETGLMMFQPALRDPLAQLQRSTGMQQGMRPDGDFLFVMLDAASTGIDQDQSIYMVLPVSDYQAFLGNYGDVKTEDGISELEAGPMGRSFAAQWGDSAVLAPSREAIAAPPQELIQLVGLSARLSDDADIFFYANLEKLAEMAVPALQGGREEILASLGRQLQASGERGQRFAPVAQAGMKELLSLAEKFLTDGRAAAASVRITPAGISTTTIADFKPDTYFGNMMTRLKGTDDTMVRGLPERDYLFYGGMKVDPQVLRAIFEELSAAVRQELKQIDDADAQALNRWIESSLAFYGAAESHSFGAWGSTAPLGRESMFQSVAVSHGDGQAMFQAYRDIIITQSQITNMFAGMTGQMQTIETTPNAVTVGDVGFDAFKVNIEFDRNSPEGMQAQRALSMLYGPQGLGGYFGAVDNKLIVAANVPQERLAELIAAAKADRSLVTDKAHLQSVLAELPPQRLMVVFVPLDQWAKTGARVASQAFGLPINLQVPPELPPVGVSVSTEETALRVDSHIPTKLVQSLIAAGMQAMGGGPGGPDEGPNAD